jgi:hypothetical protein
MSISDLASKISRLWGEVKKLSELIENLKPLQSDAGQAGSKIDGAISDASALVSKLGGSGFRSELLEDILSPVRNAPDVSGISAALSGDISEKEKEKQEKEGQMYVAQQEKAALEAEET